MPNLSPDQADALAALHTFTRSRERLLALSGPAGTGKSFLIGQFLRETDAKVSLSGTTHKAAKVAAELAGGGAVTVHSLFGLRPINDYHTGQTRLERRSKVKAEPGSLVIIDEASMIDSKLFKQLVADAETLDLKLLFIGDPYQLPPVSEAGPPVIFDTVTTLSLTVVHRQAEDNPIIGLATGFRRVLDGGSYPVIRPCQRAIQRVDRQAFGGLVKELFTSADYQRDPDYCRLVAWTNLRTRDLNTYVRSLLLGDEARRYPYLPGETLLVNEAISANDELLLANETLVTVREAASGGFTDDDGTLPGYWLVVSESGKAPLELFVPDDHTEARRHLAILRNRAAKLRKSLDDTPEDAALDRQVRTAWARYFAAKEAFADLRPPHAVTVHKSQGSTYRHVLIQVEDIARAAAQPEHLLARLLYVATTRAAETAAFYGSLPAHLYGPTRLAA